MADLSASILAKTSRKPRSLHNIPLLSAPTESPCSFSSPPSPTGEITGLEHDQLQYLNGVRGLACLIVYIWHFSWPYQPHLFFAYGLDPENRSFMQLPFIRLIYAGDAMVRVFFVLSGFVLSIGPLRAAQDGEIGTVAKKVASLGIRRGFRLFIPPVTMSLFTLIATCFGWLENLPSSTRAPSHGQEHVRLPIRKANLFLQLSDWLQWMLQSLLNPWPPYPDTPTSQYGAQFWTIPHEYRCSMTIFMLLVVQAPLRRNARILSTFGMSVFCMLLRREQEELSLFLAGMGLAALEIQRLNTKQQSKIIWKTTECVLGWLSLGFGLYLLSWPLNNGYLTPFFHLLGMLDRHHNHWHNVGAVLLLYAVLRIRVAQKFLSLTPILYLGKISYALYCVHYLMVLAVGSRLLALFWALTGTETWIQEQGGFCMAFCLTTVAIIMFSEVFYRVVDLSAIQLARTVERAISV